LPGFFFCACTVGGGVLDAPWYCMCGVRGVGDAAPYNERVLHLKKSAIHSTMLGNLNALALKREKETVL